jgi:hypothetical protein
MTDSLSGLTGSSWFAADTVEGFPLYQDFAEILPRYRARLPASSSADYRGVYRTLFEQSCQKDDTWLAGGAEEDATSSGIRKRRQQVAAMHPAVTEGIEPAAAVLCDIAAGGGHDPFAYAPQFRFVPCTAICRLRI